MTWQGYCLHFSAGVHFGGGALWDAEPTAPADTLFSALCQEALQLYGALGIERLVQWCKDGQLLISDLLPFIGQELYLPKPLRPVQIPAQNEGNSVRKKAFKKLQYIPVSQWQIYLAGKLDPLEAAETFGQLGMAEVRTMSASRAPERVETGEALPYSVGVYHFAKENGLYLIVGFAAEQQQRIFETLLEALTYSGLGGKRSAGLGRFTIEKRALPAELTKHLQPATGSCMALSLCMASPEQLENAMQDAFYLLAKRSGFVLSETYAPEQRRKRDFYAFRAGSCFAAPFQGNVFNVAGEGTHPVYRYAVPLWLRLNEEV
jgi:CRISPR-associated protein Csm4